MRKIVILAALAAFVSAGAAQAASVMTSKGTQGLVFQFSGLSNLGVSSYNAGVTPDLGNFKLIGDAGTFGIGFKHYMNDMMAIRPSLEIGIASNKVNAQAGGFTDYKESLTSLGLSAVLEKHMPSPATPVSPFLGVGAGFGIASYKEEPSRETSPPNGRLLETKVSGTSFAAFGVAGFEVAVMDGVNLGGEYRLGFKATSGSIEMKAQGVETDKTDGSSFGLGFGSASLFANIAWK
ncbi:MAG: outer membrane beta-barrel protein [Candidatus Eisenbacteria bacterium]